MWQLGVEKFVTRFYWKNLKRRYLLEDAGIDGKTTLIFRSLLKQGVRV